MADRLNLTKSKNRRFLEELLKQLRTNSLIENANPTIDPLGNDEFGIYVDAGVKKNNITFKQLQCGIEYFKVGWNAHREQTNRPPKIYQR